MRQVLASFEESGQSLRASSKICRFCHEEFTLIPGKPGRIDVCLEKRCRVLDTKQAPEPEKLKGWTAWEGKHTPVMTVTTAHEANRVNRLLRRRSHNANLPGIGSYVQPTPKDCA
jgi:hypothetical protein